MRRLVLCEQAAARGTRCACHSTVWLCTTCARAQSVLMVGLCLGAQQAAVVHRAQVRHGRPARGGRVGGGARPWHAASVCCSQAQHCLELSLPAGTDSGSRRPKLGHHFLAQKWQKASTCAQAFQRPGGKIIDREDDYRRRRLNRIISPTRNDAFAMGDKTPDASVRTYADVMREQQLARERDNTLKNIADKRRDEEEEAAMDRDNPTKASGLAAPAQPAPAAQPAAAAEAAAGGKRRNRWDQSGGGDACAPCLGQAPSMRCEVLSPGNARLARHCAWCWCVALHLWAQRPAVCTRHNVLCSLHGSPSISKGSLGHSVAPERCWLRRKKARTSWDEPEATPALGRWEATPGRVDEMGATPGRADATPGGASRWDATPTPGRLGSEATPRRNRWDDATPTPGRVRLISTG